MKKGSVWMIKEGSMPILIGDKRRIIGCYFLLWLTKYIYIYIYYDETDLNLLKLIA